MGRNAQRPREIAMRGGGAEGVDRDMDSDGMLDEGGGAAGRGGG